VELTAEVAASPDQVFTYLTEHFDDLWPGGMDRVRDGSDPSEPLGLGFVRTMHTGAGDLDEEIVTHQRPQLIEYKVINGDEARIHNHLGRIELGERNGGTHIDYTVTFDFKPSFLGPVGAHVMGTTWRLRSKRQLHKAFPG